MLALDPPDGGATVGGIVASGDSGPLRSRYGGVRDLVVGMHVALSDGTRAKAGGKVIKNVAGYDLAKLFAGSFGTLGAILEVAVRLHPLPAVHGHRRSGAPGDAAMLAPRRPPRSPTRRSSTAGSTCAGRTAPGAVLARFGGAAPRPQAETAARMLARSRARHGPGRGGRRGSGPRSATASARDRASPTRWCGCPGCRRTCRELLAAAERHSALLVGRAPLGLSWLRLERSRRPCRTRVDDAAAGSRRAVVLDAPAEVRERVDPWGERDAAVLALMRRVKDRFDPAGACAPGVLV